LSEEDSPTPQTDKLPDTFAGIGVSANPQATGTPIAGNALFAKCVNGSSTCSFTFLDIAPDASHPGSVKTSISSGIAQEVLKIGSVPILVVGTGGATLDDDPVVMWSAGAAAPFRLKHSNWWAMPIVRVMQTPGGDGAVQVIPGLMFVNGWGS